MGQKWELATRAVGDGTLGVQKYVISQSSRIDFVWTSSNGSRYVGSNPAIEDTEAKIQVFRLPERHAKYDTKIERDGRYPVVWSSSRKMVIVNFDSEYLL